MKRLTPTNRVLRSANSEERTTACCSGVGVRMTQNDRKIKLEKHEPNRSPSSSPCWEQIINS